MNKTEGFDTMEAMKEIEDRIYSRSTDFVAREVAQEFILVPIRQHLNSARNIYVLNPTGAACWRLMDGTRSLSEIMRLLSSEYDVSEETLKKDFPPLVEDLVSIDAIKET